MELPLICNLRLPRGPMVSPSLRIFWPSSRDTRSQLTNIGMRIGDDWSQDNFPPSKQWSTTGLYSMSDLDVWLPLLCCYQGCQCRPSNLSVTRRISSSSTCVRCACMEWSARPYQWPSSRICKVRIDVGERSAGLIFVVETDYSDSALAGLCHRYPCPYHRRKYVRYGNFSGTCIKKCDNTLLFIPLHCFFHDP